MNVMYVTLAKIHLLECDEKYKQINWMENDMVCWSNLLTNVQHTVKNIDLFQNVNCK